MVTEHRCIRQWCELTAPAMCVLLYMQVELLDVK
jgi:hypothetical protein